MNRTTENQLFGSFAGSDVQAIRHKPPLKIYKSSYVFFLFSDDVCMIMKFLSNSPICHMTANTFPQLPNPSVVTLTANQHFAVNRWNTNYSGMKQKQNFKYILLHFFEIFFSCTVFTFSTQKGYWMLFYRFIMFRKSLLFTALSKYLN